MYDCSVKTLYLYKKLCIVLFVLLFYALQRPQRLSEKYQREPLAVILQRFLFIRDETKIGRHVT